MPLQRGSWLGSGDGGIAAPSGLNCCVTEQPLCFTPTQAGQFAEVSRPSSIRSWARFPLTCGVAAGSALQTSICKPKKDNSAAGFFPFLFAEGQVEGAAAMGGTGGAGELLRAGVAG